MLQLQALNRSPDIRAYEHNHPDTPLIIVASCAVGAYAKALNIEAGATTFVVNDIDLCAPKDTKTFFQERGWRTETHRGVETVRWDIPVDEQGRVITIDIGESAHVWTYEKVLGQAVEIANRPIMHPRMTLEWYESMRRDDVLYPDEPRVNDRTKIEFLRDRVIPRLGELTLCKH